MSELILGHYEIVNKIGQGGMGVVYLARDTRLERKVALKELFIPESVPFHEHETFVKAFLKEARTVAGLTHQNIVVVYEAGEDNGRYFIAMEYLDGKNLSQYIAERDAGYIDTHAVESIISQVAHALEYSHRKGIIHRDVKPSNIMLLIDGRVKIMDFGIARVANSAATTLTGRVIGSPRFMAPEQFFGFPGDERSDIFSLGVVTYELLTGRYPFDCDNTSDTQQKILNTTPVPPTFLNPMIPEFMEKIVVRALEKNPYNRYQNVTELIADLKSKIAIKPNAYRTSISSNNIGQTRKLRDFPKRKKLFAATIISAIILSILAGIILLSLATNTDTGPTVNLPLSSYHSESTVYRENTYSTPSSIRTLKSEDELYTFLAEKRDGNAHYSGPEAANSEIEKRNGMVTIKVVYTMPIQQMISGLNRGKSSGSVTACKSNLKTLGIALEMYSSDNQGRYPSRLAQIVPNYLKNIPTCPSAGYDTYSSGYQSAVSPDCYTVMCTGSYHAQFGLPENCPKYNAVQGLIEQ